MTGANIKKCQTWESSRIKKAIVINEFSTFKFLTTQNFVVKG